MGERRPLVAIQAVKDLGEGRPAVAWAPHGVVDAIEMPGADARRRMDEREGATVP